jgi:hypothetical protein
VSLAEDEPVVQALPGVSRADLRPVGRGSLADGELLAQGQILEGELAVVIEEEGEEPEHVEQEADRSTIHGRTGAWRRTPRE